MCCFSDQVSLKNLFSPTSHWKKKELCVPKSLGNISCIIGQNCDTWQSQNRLQGTKYAYLSNQKSTSRAEVLCWSGFSGETDPVENKHAHTHIYIYVDVCVCVCVYIHIHKEIYFKELAHITVASLKLVGQASRLEAL